MYKSTIKEAISEWNRKNPKLRKKTLGSVAKELGISTPAISQLDNSSQFQKHSEVIFKFKNKQNQIDNFELYCQLDVPIIQKLKKLKDLLNCEIYDLIGKE